MPDYPLLGKAHLACVKRRLSGAQPKGERS
jgi:hypothetical protein